MGELRRDFSTASLEQWIEAHNLRSIPRVDSEDKFRAAIARLSSENNLPQLQLDPLRVTANFQRPLQPSPALGTAAAIGAPPAIGELPEPGSLRLGGMPRVESLEFLAAMFKTQSQNRSGNYVKEEPGEQGNGTEPQGTFPSLPPIRPPVSMSRPMAGLMPSQNLVPSQSMNPSHSGSEGQTSTEPGSSVAPTGRGGARSRAQRDNVDQSLHKLMKESKTETRKARRMLSNRESARRSRRRKQEHLGMLESKISELEREKDDLHGLNRNLVAELDLAHRRIEDLERQLEKSEMKS